MPNIEDRAGAATVDKYLTFVLADEEYGVDIMCVQEIISSLPITRVPRTPAYIRGVINLRGAVMPVMDLRARFGLPESRTPDQVMIVIDLERTRIALVVDRVSEVASIRGTDITPVPDFGAACRTEFLRGLGAANGRLRLLLDMARVLSTEELVHVAAIPSTAGGTVQHAGTAQS